MAFVTIARPTGFDNVKPCKWIAEDEVLSKSWDGIRQAILKQGAVVTLRRGAELELAVKEVALLVEGGVYATSTNELNAGRALLVRLFERGDLFANTITSGLALRLTAHCATTCIVFKGSAIDAAETSLRFSHAVLPIMRAGLANDFANAVQETSCTDKGRIERVLRMLANHPTAVITRFGREVEAGKQQIRDLAGVQKRSASRAFSALEDEGFVSFSGYKRLFVQ